MKILKSSFIAAELRAYVVATHDQQAIEELFVNRRNPNAKKYSPPLDDEGIKIMEEAIRQKVNDVKGK